MGEREAERFMCCERGGTARYHPAPCVGRAVPLDPVSGELAQGARDQEG